jgi:hypothetical protein
MFDEMRICTKNEKDVDVSIIVYPKSKVEINYGCCSVQVKGGEFVFKNVFLKSCAKIILFDKNGNCMYHVE